MPKGSNSSKTEVGNAGKLAVFDLLFWNPTSKVVSKRNSDTVYGKPADIKDILKRYNELKIDSLDQPPDSVFLLLSTILQRALEEVRKWENVYYIEYPKLEKIKPEKELRSLGKDDHTQFVLACSFVMKWQSRYLCDKPWVIEERAIFITLSQLIDKYCPRKVPWSAESLNLFISNIAHHEDKKLRSLFSRSMPMIGELLSRPGMSEMLNDQSHSVLPKVREELSGYTPTKLDRERLQAVDIAIASKQGEPTHLFHEIRDWAIQLNQLIDRLGKDERSAAVKLCRHASTCNASKPSKVWVAGAIKMVDETDQPIRTVLLSTLEKTLEIAAKYQPLDDDPYNHAHRDQFENFYERHNENTFRLLGLICIAGAMGNRSLAVRLVECIQAAASIKAKFRFQAAPFATGCVRALTLCSDFELSIDMLNRVALRVRWPIVRKLANKSLADISKRVGIDPVDAEEAYVPDFGLTSGHLKQQFDKIFSNLVVVSSDKVIVSWGDVSGAQLKPSAAYKSIGKEAASSLKELVKDVETALPAQRTRLELLLREAREWPVDKWLKRYLEHGLLSPMVAKLIWLVDGQAAIFCDGIAQDVNGVQIPITADTKITLWHPIDDSVDNIVRWRQRLQAMEITQPFKQAYREVYLLTDAELRTSTYSNRFAAHILKTATLLAIGQTRKWKVSLYGKATIDLPKFNLRAEYWSEAAGDNYNDIGGPVYLSTDQVRFYKMGDESPIPLKDVPKLIFSEVFRDIDLFVGISSVGNDPNWQDGGPQGRYRDYWRSYSFGDLTESARTRHAVLESLLPRLTRLKGIWSLTDKFLVIKGKKRTYKIHLGSGNILMEPNDQYLCIVPDRSSTGDSMSGVFLPFEGDATLSIILSKAFLLAEDEKIKDQTIVRQIG